MSWKVVVRPEAGDDAAWYDRRQQGLGEQFVEEILRVYDGLAVNPYLNSRRHPRKMFAGVFQNAFLIASFTRSSTLRR